MAKSAKTFHCRIDTPDGRVAEGEFVSAKLPALDGYIGILVGRAPVAAVVTTGLITLTPLEGQAKELFVSRGFLQVSRNNLVVLAEESKPVDQLDRDRAWDLLQQTYKMPRETVEQVAMRDEAVYAARVRFSLAQRGRKTMTSVEQMLSQGPG
jgi:F-type H+-transporting ATPase subunit epsilon